MLRVSELVILTLFSTTVACAGSAASEDGVVVAAVDARDDDVVDAASLDADAIARDATDSATGDAAIDTRSVDAASNDAPSIDAGSHCQITDTTVYCEHNVTTLVASLTVRRDVYWQTPTTPAPAAGHPVVIIYQGSFGAPALTWGVKLSKDMPFGGFYQGLLQARLLDRGFTVVAPSAAGGSVWQTNAGIPWESSTDHQVITKLLEDLAKDVYGPVDMSRVYATGVSSGGYMTSRMAVSYPGKFRALAIQSASYATCLGPLCNVPDTLPADHAPTLFLHGENDTTVPISTMHPYREKLAKMGATIDPVVDPAAGHEWLSVAPERITEWFVTH